MPESIPEPEPFRWQGFLQHSHEPIFLLNRRRRLLFANRAWERATGLRFADMRGQLCRRVSQPEDVEPWQWILAALVPTAEVLAGRPGTLRRRIAHGPQPGWWDLSFFPLHGEQGLLGVLGKIAVLPSSGTVHQPLPDKIVNLRQQFVQQFDLQLLTSPLPAMMRLKEQARLASQTEVPALLVGPAGSGKHWLARAIHQAGPRREQPFVRLDAERLSPRVLTQVLFHHGERFAPGTIYVREPGRLPREMQARLAAILTEEKRPRFLAGMRQVTGDMLPELLCGLSTLTITVPPLTERLSDLEFLVPALLQRVRAASAPVPSVSAEAMEILRSHPWPNNLSELSDVLYAAGTRAKDGIVQPGDLPFYLHAEARSSERTLPLDALLEQVEKRLIVLALRLSQNNKTQAAELLGIWRARLIRRMEGLGLV